MPVDNPSDIIKRIQSGNWNESDLESLRQLLQSNDNDTLQQLSKFNISIDEGKDIHIGDRNYFNWSDEAIQAVVEVVQQGKGVAVFNPTGKVTIYNYNNNFREEQSTPELTRLVTKLNNARLQGEEGDRKTGSFYTYNIWLEDVSLENSHDSTEDNCHIQQYTITGKWNSKVYKEINAFGLRVDTPWGHNKTPHGQFTVKVEILNGRVTQIKPDVARYNDSANNYAADKAKKLIKSEISGVLRVF
ncbi:hypothetical protein [Moorena sp. SIO3I6]|uniref:hypothetical protein n=1 Tax=Moorena sp. SIO3I6 TaxID=2607831 RepID=UPI0013FCB54D|nr:hypothetical protein [Moorena sp. SIO3I6]NEP25591.1 hypothetical protein [Moorena sp. SIO3I6]